MNAYTSTPNAIATNTNCPAAAGRASAIHSRLPTAAPAIGNAIYDAIGARVRSLPITPEKILAALGKIPGKEMKSSIA